MTSSESIALQNLNEVSHMKKEISLEEYFSAFRKNIIGNQQCFESPFGKKQIIYADWTASGRAYRPIEEFILNQILPFMANTHTESTITGKKMTAAYEEAKSIVKEHVHANEDDVLIFCGSGMTSAVNKLQRILGLRIPERIMDYVKEERPQEVEELKDNVNNIINVCSKHLQLDEVLRPIVFVTHMEHHSNQTTWLET